MGGRGGRSAMVIAPLLGGLVIVAAVGARMMTAEIPDPFAQKEPADVTCWDGKTRPEQDCGSPTGRAGLRWMFPSFKPSDLDCRNLLLERPKSTRPTMFQCRGRVGAGPVRITYSELASVERGSNYLEKAYGDPPEELDDHLGQRLLWTEGRKPRNRAYDLAVMYAELPFAVEVRAGSAVARDRALASLIRFRPASDASVRPFE